MRVCVCLCVCVCVCACARVRVRVCVCVWPAIANINYLTRNKIIVRTACALHIRGVGTYLKVGGLK